MTGKIATFLNNWKFVLFILLVTASVTFVLMSAIVGSQSFQQCICKNEKYEAASPLVKQKARFPIYVYGVVRCSGAFLQTHNGAIAALASLIIAAFTGTLWYATAGMLKTSTEQSTETKRSIAEAARAATAMEEVAKHFADNVAAVRERSAQQMRAYVSVIVFGGIYQERDKNLKFEGKPAMVNTGHTPAHKVSYRAGAAILPVPLPSDFSFPLPEKPAGAATLGPQQNFIMSAVVESFCDDVEVPAIKLGNKGKALYVWGVVNYNDIFGEHQYTKFCQVITWIPNPPNPDRIMGYFVTDYNESK